MVLTATTVVFFFFFLLLFSSSFSFSSSSSSVLQIFLNFGLLSDTFPIFPVFSSLLSNDRFS